MKIAVGSDHRGYLQKTRVVLLLQERGHEVIDVGTHDSASVDYPDIAAMVGQLVSRGDVDRGILICGTGVGMAIAANKFAGVRASAIHDELTAELCRRHNDVNVMCLSGDMLGNRPLDAMLDIWLNTQFEAGRHARRVEKIQQLEHRTSER
jgi:ribose 5-phosphate isomerase B